MCSDIRKEIGVGIIDDCDSDRKDMIRWIKDSKCCKLLFEINNGTEAFSKVTEHEPDVLILDDAMPVKGGFDVLKDLSCIAPTIRPYVIMVSDIASSVMIRGALRMGADDFMPKPFTKYNFVQRISMFDPYLIMSDNNGMIKDIGYAGDINNYTMAWHGYMIRDRYRSKPDKREVSRSAEELLTKACFAIGGYGFKYIVDAVTAIIINKMKGYIVSKEVYPRVAELYNTSVTTVEFQIRYAISNAWMLCTAAGKTGCIFDGYTKKPTNVEFLKKMTYYIEKRCDEC